MKTKYDVEIGKGKVVRLTEKQLIDMLAKAVRRVLLGDEDRRFVIFSYDATQDFKDQYKKKYKHEFDLEEFGAEIGNLETLEIQGKPVESTLVLEANDPSCYQELVELINEKFEDLPYVIGVVEKKDGEDLYNVNPNPDSEDDNF